MALIMGREGELKTSTMHSEIDDGLVGHWKFNEGSGTSVADDSPYGHDITLYGAPTWVSGAHAKTGNAAIDLDNSGTQYGLVEKKYTFKDFTICAWVRWDGGESASQGNIISCYDTGTDPWWALFMNAADVMQFQYDDGSTEGTCTGTTHLDSPQAFHFLAGVYDQTNSIGRAFVDGVQEGTDSPMGEENVAAVQELYFGRAPGGTGSWDGVIDEVRLYARALRPDEIWYLYNYATGKSPSGTGTTANLPLDTWSLDMTQEISEISSFSDTSKKFAYTGKTRSGSCSGTLDLSSRVPIEGSEDHDIVLAGTENNAFILRSDDQGDTAEAVYDAKIGQGETIVYSLAYCGKGVCLAGTGDVSANIMRSTDYGNTWSEVYDGAATETETRIMSLCYLENSIVLAGTYNQPYLLRSTDNGATWAAGIDVDTVHTLTSDSIAAIEYLGNGIVLVGIGGISDTYIIRSTDYGASWAAAEYNINSSLSLDLDDVWDMTYCGAGVVFVAVGGGTDDAYIIKSADYGQTWATSYDAGALDGDMLSIEYVGNNTVVAGTGPTNGVIVRTTDLGDNWSSLGQHGSEVQIHSLAWLGGQIVVGGTGNSGLIIRSTDRGATWGTGFDVGTPYTESDVRAVCAIGTGHEEMLTNAISNLRRVDAEFVTSGSESLFCRCLVNRVSVGAPVGGKATFAMDFDVDGEIDHEG